MPAAAEVAAHIKWAPEQRQLFSNRKKPGQSQPMRECSQYIFILIKFKIIKLDNKWKKVIKAVNEGERNQQAKTKGCVLGTECCVVIDCREDAIVQ